MLIFFLRRVKTSQICAYISDRYLRNIIMLVKKYRMIAWLGYMYVCSPSIVNPSVYAKFVFSCSRLASVSVQSSHGRMDSKVHCDSHVHAKLHETFGFFIVSSSGKHVFTTQLRHALLIYSCYLHGCRKSV